MPITQRAVVIQFNYQGHHQWAKCPLCLAVGPQKEQVIEHLNKVHSLPGEEWTQVEAHDVRAGLNTFWVAVCTFDLTKVRQSTPEQDRKALDSMKKAGVLPPEVAHRIAASIEEAAMKKKQAAKSPPLAPPVKKHVAKPKSSEAILKGVIPDPKERARLVEKVREIAVAVTAPKKLKKSKSKKKGGKK